MNEFKFMTVNEFMSGSVKSDLFKFSEEEIAEMHDSFMEHRQRMNEDWSILANQVVGTEVW